MTKTFSTLLTISILLSAVFLTSFSMFESADAAKAKGSPQSQGAKSFGAKTSSKVCGDKLCKEGKTVIPKPESKAKPVACTREYMPVCGADGITYGNMCMLKASGAELAYKGACEEAAKPAAPMEKPEAPKLHKSTITTGTITSATDPGLGHETHQLAVILPPSEKIYKGTLTFAASEPIQLVSLTGPLAEGEDKGQLIWTPDGTTKFALTIVDAKESSGTWSFAGNALAVHTKNTEPFTVSYTVVASQ